MCRKLVSLQTARSLNESDFDEDGQPIYDTYYIQCMYSKGHRVPVPGDMKYGTVKDWHPPPPPDMPAPSQRRAIRVQHTIPCNDNEATLR